MNRAERAKLAEETLETLDRGQYVTTSGRKIELADRIDRCVANTALYCPNDLAGDLAFEMPRLDAEIVVVNKSTLEGARQVVDSERFDRVGVLNFASAKRPGGGFLNGSAAQEESLARSSALYASLQQHPEFYAYHRRMKESAYADCMIYSPDCPIFRDDTGRLLDRPYCVDFITSAAPNAGAMRRTRRRQLPAILKQRAGRILALAASKRCDALVLGAWGCGVFKNDPTVIAAVFREFLMEGGNYCGCFAHVRFSVLDEPGRLANFTAFSEAFGFREC